VLDILGRFFVNKVDEHDSERNSPHMQLSGLKSPPYFEERSESIDPGSRSKHAALGMYLPSLPNTKKMEIKVNIRDYQLVRNRSALKGDEDSSQ